MHKYLVALLLVVPLGVSASFERDLYYGLRSNSQVEELQEFLTEQGLYTGPITGNFFSLTRTAVKSFQFRELISPVSGYFGPLTRAKANSLLSAVTDESGVSISPAITPPSTTDDVVAKLTASIALLTQQLNELKAQQAKLDAQQQTLSQQATILGTIQQEQAKQSGTLTQIQTNTTPPPPPPPLPTVTLTLDKYRTPEGIYIVDDGKFTFTWSSTNADKCIGNAQDYVSGYVSGGIRDPQKWGWFGDKATSGIQTVIAQESGEFRFWIECLNSSSGKYSDPLTIRIRQLSPPPPPLTVVSFDSDGISNTYSQPITVESITFEVTNCLRLLNPGEFNISITFQRRGELAMQYFPVASSSLALTVPLDTPIQNCSIIALTVPFNIQIPANGREWIQTYSAFGQIHSVIRNIRAGSFFQAKIQSVKVSPEVRTAFGSYYSWSN